MRIDTNYYNYIHYDKRSIEPKGYYILQPVQPRGCENQRCIRPVSGGTEGRSEYILSVGQWHGRGKYNNDDCD